jgi:redox-sensitive bicupin YhaK (pirin superfamily)
VINEDRVAPGTGFGRHGHRDMEILTYVLSGELTHTDSLGNGSAIRPGELQRMSAGTGVLHSEANQSKTDPVHLYQIWLLPDRKGHTPGYEQKAFTLSDSEGRSLLLASPDGRDGSLTIHQDSLLWLARPVPGQPLSLDLSPGRHAWVQVTRGSATLNGQPLVAGDGAAVSDEPSLSLSAEGDAEVLVFDLS